MKPNGFMLVDDLYDEYIKQLEKIEGELPYYCKNRNTFFKHLNMAIHHSLQGRDQNDILFEMGKNQQNMYEIRATYGHTNRHVQNNELFDNEIDKKL